MTIRMLGRRAFMSFDDLLDRGEAVLAQGMPWPAGRRAGRWGIEARLSNHGRVEGSQTENCCAISEG
jgi:hypothetical protein